MTISPRTRDPFLTLARLKDARTRAFAPGEQVPEALRSRHCPDHGDTRLGLGYVRALLLLLTGGVHRVGYDPDHPGGQATLSSGSRHYELDWLPDASTDSLAVGGFRHSEGQPTYQVAVLGFLELWKGYHRDDARDGADELIARWSALLRHLDERLPRSTPGDAWAFGALEHELTADAESRAAFVAVGSALEWALRLVLPDRRSRAIRVAPDPVWPHPASATLTSTDLLTAAPIPAAARAPAPDPAAPAPAPAPEPTPAPLVVGPYIARIRQALARPGATLMLVGPTGTGKSYQTVQAAAQLGLGLELVTFDPGMDAQEPIGGYAPQRAASDDPAIDPWLDLWPAGTNGSAPGMAEALRAQTRIQYLALHQQTTSRSAWQAIDGPITRWARRAIAGEEMLLFLDELARGHPSVVSMVMGILNRHSAAAIARMGLSTPDAGAAGTYHVVTAWHTRERLVVPATRVRLVAAANLGDRYQGADLSDPAFRRRWDAWLHLARYPDPVQRTILAAQVGLSASDRLLSALLAVATAVSAYEHANATLISTLDLPTLITWGQSVQARQAAGQARAEAFTSAAIDTWLERLCPLAGEDLDTSVRDALQRLVTDTAKTLTDE